jgi:hypothetical protein
MEKNINRQVDLLDVIDLACKVEYRRLLGKRRSDDSFKSPPPLYNKVHVRMKNFISDLTGLRFRSSANIAVLQ